MIAVGVSGKISQRASTGQHWGSGLGSGFGGLGSASAAGGGGGVGGGFGLGRAHYQLAHALINDKDDAHGRLMGLLTHTGLLPAFSPQHCQTLYTTQMHLAGCLGLCAELQKALQRVSGDTTSHHITSHHITSHPINISYQPTPPTNPPSKTTQSTQPCQLTPSTPPFTTNPQAMQLTQPLSVPPPPPLP